MRLQLPTAMRPAILALAAILSMATTTAAQKTRTATPGPTSSTNPPYSASVYSDPKATSNSLKSLRWRNVGPMRGGRAVAVTGDPTKPMVFYFGGVNGGVWKTVNGGARWSNITDGKSDISSVPGFADARTVVGVPEVCTASGAPTTALMVAATCQRGTRHAITAIASSTSAARPRNMARQPTTGINHCTGKVEATMPSEPDISIQALARR